MKEVEVVIKSNGNGKYPLQIGKTYKVTAELKGIFEQIGVLDEPKTEVIQEPKEPKSKK